MLAEKYRPKDFSQVIGQERVIRALSYYLDRSDDNETGQAFLLTGPSGIGKTTLADCAADYWKVAEFDRWKIESAECSVERLRELDRDWRFFGMGPLSRKMYLIDEVHTVSGRASDRFLSLLESIPRHVLLVATTTETDWTDGILFSRWVRLDLQKPRASDVAEYLEAIAAREGLPIPADPQWAVKMVKYAGLNIRELLNQLPARLLAMEPETAAA